MTKYDEESRQGLLRQWKQARAEGHSQKAFCRTAGISARTLRSWLASEGAPKASAKEAATILRRMGRHLLAAAEAIDVGSPEDPAPGTPGKSASDSPTASAVCNPGQPLAQQCSPPATLSSHSSCGSEPDDGENAAMSQEAGLKGKVIWDFGE